MKLTGIIIGVIGAAMFVWHLVRVFLNVEVRTGPFTHHWPSLIGGILMFAGIWLWVAGHRRQKR